LELRQRARDDLEGRRRALLLELADLRARRTELREEVRRRLLQELPADVRVGVRYAEDLREYERLLTQALRGGGRPYAEVVRAVLDAPLAPQELADLVRGGAGSELQERLRLPAAQARWALERLAASGLLRAIEAVELGDVPSIQLRVNGALKDS